MKKGCPKICNFSPGSLNMPFVLLIFSATLGGFSHRAFALTRETVEPNNVSSDNVRIVTDADIYRNRAFEEPIVPLGSKATTASENAILFNVLQARIEAGAGGDEDVSSVEKFLETFPASPWRVALLTDLGLQYRRTGYFNRAMEAWRQAWEIGKEETDPRARAVTDRAISQLMDLTSRLGRRDDLVRLLNAVQGREIGGSAAEVVETARAGLWMMEHNAGSTFKCGPWSLARILNVTRPNEPLANALEAEQSPREGISLPRVCELADQLHMGYRMAWRQPGTPVPTPSVVHWKSGHYAALIRMDGQSGRYLAQDPTFGRDIWVSRAALDDEGSGYFLIPQVAQLPAGWRAVSAEEASVVRGKGSPDQIDEDAYEDDDWDTGDIPPDPEDTDIPDVVPPQDDPSTNPPGGCGMPFAKIKAAISSSTIVDTPLFYVPPHGPKVNLTVRYNQRERNQPSNFFYSNLGPRWTFDWLSFLVDDPTAPQADVKLYAKGGGAESYTGFAAGNGQSSVQPYSSAFLVRTGSDSYERQIANGTRELFNLSDGSTSTRHIFLTQIIDPRGETLSFSYDPAFRMVTVTDALGQASQIAYQSNDAASFGFYRIVSVTDPFGRSVHFDYTASGQLQQVTDVVGMASQFSYVSGDVINKMTTPYGDTVIEVGQIGIDRWVQMTDPIGGKQRAEFHGTAPVSGSDAFAPAGGGIGVMNQYLNFRNTFYWDKKQMAMGAGDLSKSTTFHWLHSSSMAATSSRTLESVKKPLKGRVSYTYSGQPWSISEGNTKHIQAAARVLKDFSTQANWRDHDNKYKRTTKAVDAVGRATSIAYSGDGVDLLEVRQTTGGRSDLLSQRTFNAQHLPLTVTDAAGQMTQISYNAFGEPTAVTPPVRAANGGAAETSTMAYDTQGYLTQVTGPTPGSTKTYTYDAMGRVHTATDSEGYTLTMDYDDLNRPLKVTYPDGTYTQTIYNRLDPEWTCDRLGRWTRTLHNELRQVVAVQDPQGRLTQFEWCKCGALTKLIDPMGKITKWDYDLEGRVTAKTYLDGTQETYAYDAATGKLASVTDALGQVTNYAYTFEGLLAKTTYGNAKTPTPAVKFTYDSVYRRLQTMSDGIGVTSYTYNAVNASVGAGQLASVNGPLPNSTISYTYDELGRAVGVEVNGVPSTSTYDALGRVTSTTNALGTFTPTYVDTTSGRLASVSYPNGMNVAYDYFGVQGDLRLKRIKYADAGGALLGSQDDYTYDAQGRIASWTLTRSGVSGSEVMLPEYDQADQLVAATLKDGTSGNQLKAYAYGYDKSGNRTSEQIDNGVTSADHNNLNQLIATSGGGPLRFAGTVSEPWSSVTVGGIAVQVDHSNGRFTGFANVTVGTSTVAVTATDPSGNAKTQNYQVSAAAGSMPRSYAYDAVGEMISDGSRTFEWDAADRLSAVNNDTHRSEFTYDGLGRRTLTVEKEGGVTVGSNSYLWATNTAAFPCEERDATGALTSVRYFSQGMQITSGLHPGNYVYTRDHLGSVNGLIDDVGVIRALYSYDPFGRRSLNLITNDPVEEPFGFTGHYLHVPSALYLTAHRVYDANIARWLSRDPIQEQGGFNLYAYVANNPLCSHDPLGLFLEPNDSMINAIQVTGRQVRSALFTNPVTNGPVSGLMNYMFGYGNRARLGPDVLSSLSDLQRDSPWPQGTNINMAEDEYQTWSHPYDSALIMFTLGQFRYTNDGNATLISDTYGFPGQNDTHYGDFDTHNSGLSSIPGAPYDETGDYLTPKQPTGEKCNK